MNPARAEPALCDFEATTFAEQDVAGRHANVFEQDFAVAMYLKDFLSPPVPAGLLKYNIIDEETHPGGLDGWFRELAAREPRVIVIGPAERPVFRPAWPLLASDYDRKRAAQWTVLRRKAG